MPITSNDLGIQSGVSRKVGAWSPNRQDDRTSPMNCQTKMAQNNKREQVEDEARDQPRPPRQPRLHELDVVEGAVDVGDRQAQEGDGDQHIAADLVRHLE